MDQLKNQTKILRMFVCPTCKVELDMTFVSSARALGWTIPDVDNRFINIGKCKRCGKSYDVYVEVNAIEVKDGVN